MRPCQQRFQTQYQACLIVTRRRWRLRFAFLWFLGRSFRNLTVPYMVDRLIRLAFAGVIFRIFRHSCTFKFKRRSAHLTEGETRLESPLSPAFPCALTASREPPSTESWVPARLFGVQRPMLWLKYQDSHHLVNRNQQMVISPINKAIIAVARRTERMASW